MAASVGDARMTIGKGKTRLQARLERELRGEVLFDAASRGRYSTDASIYQIEPIGVVVPTDQADAATAFAIALDEGVPVLPRGAGTSQCGQTVGEAVVIDVSKHLNKVVAFDRERATAIVEPGIVLDKLNAFLRPHGLWFPVDVSTSAQATIGGMAGNNSCGSRSIRYGNMVHNVLGIDAVLADGTEAHFGEVDGNLSSLAGSPRLVELAGRLRAIAAREAAEIEARYPKLLRRVGGYNLETVRPEGHNLAHILVGSEGTLAFSRRLHLRLSPLPRHRTLGVCHFPTFYQAMDLTQHIVTLGPTAVELVDRTMIELARGNPAFAGTVAKFLKGEPDAILLVEFAGDDQAEQVAKLRDLVVLLGDLGLPGSVVEVTDPALQRDIWEVRKAGLNIMMSMKGDGKPVSFIEDCAVPLEHLADYTARLTQVFEKHGTKGTWYAHASVGCLHVRPILNMKTEEGPRQMRAIAEEAAALVREYKGAYSGEHGDGLVRSEWIAPFFGPQLTKAFEEIKDLFDPKGLLNPGKIVRPSKMDDRTLFRFGPRYRPEPFKPALDWPDPGGFLGAVEMCNNNGHCRKFDAGTMCPSWRVTGNERDVTRGRANTLRLALSGQLGPDALASDALYETMSLCVGCKGCKRECPTGVDMTRMKTEFLYHYRKRNGLRLFDRLVAYLPRYARVASRLRFAFGLRDLMPGLAERITGFARARRRRAAGRHLQHLVRAGECGGGARGAAHRGLSRAGDRRRRQSPALLRPHLPCGRPGGRGARGGEAPDPGAGALCRAWPADRGAGALLPVHPARRIPGAAAGPSRAQARRPGDAVRGVPSARAGGEALQAAAYRSAAEARAAAWALPPEGVRCREADGSAAQGDP
jgi:FAD/FMN-containing dehydrogenase/ferredoxin